MVSFWQLILIFAIVLILFGAGKIPLIMKDLGSGLRAFKKGIEGIPDNDDNSDDLLKSRCSNHCGSKGSCLKRSLKKRTTSSEEDSDKTFSKKKNTKVKKSKIKTIKTKK